MRVEESVEIRRPPGEVFAYVCEVGNYPNWMAHALDVRKDTDGPPHEGDTFAVAIKSMGRRFETPYERTSYEADRRCTDEALGGPIPSQRWQSVFHEVPGGTRVTRAVSVHSGGFLKLLEPLQKWAAARQIRKDLADAEARGRGAVGEAGKMTSRKADDREAVRAGRVGSRRGV